MSERLLKTDSQIKIRLGFPRKKEPIYVRARVAWIKKMERLPGEPVNKYKVGLEFIKLKNKYKKILSKELEF